MVMHARKYPRLNDGYYDRGQGHSYEDKPSNKSRSSKYVEPKDSPIYTRHREDSPSRPSPRYQGKSSYSEREKDRMARVSSDSPVEKRVNHSSHRGSSHKNGKGKDHHKDKDHKAEIQKSAIQVSGDWSEHRSSSGKKYYYNCKTENSQWEKPKDWVDTPKSEIIRKEKDNRDKQGSRGHDDRYKHSSYEKYGSQQQTRHSERNMSFTTPETKRQSSTISSSQKLLQSQKSWPSGNHVGYNTLRGTPVSSQKDSLRSNSGGSKHEMRTPEYEHHELRTNDGSSHKLYNKHGSTTPGRNNSMSNSHDGGHYHSNRHLHRTSSSSSGHAHGRGHEDAEDMDISPGSTPTEESMSEKLQPYLSKLPTASSGSTATTSTAASLPVNLLNQLNDGRGLMNSQSITHQAIQTLQKLQEALIVQQRQQQQHLAQLLQQTSQQQQQQQQAPPSQTSHATSTSATTTTTSSTTQPEPTSQIPKQNGSQSPESDGTPLQSPELNLPESEANRPHFVNIEEKSPKSEEQNLSSRRGSPTPSQNSVIGATSQLAAAAALKKPDSIELPASLANYYDDSLIGHVSSWVEEGRELERGADRFSEEAHNIGALGSTQVSADLKKARSWVRVSEIQSTLQEQRILFLRQQIKELENMRSQNTFMPGDT